MPKRLALFRSEEISLASAGIIDVIAKIFRPVIWLLSHSTDFVVRAFGVDPKEQRSAMSEEELLDLGADGLRRDHTSRRSFFADRLALALVADQAAYRKVYEALTGMTCYNIDPRSIEDVTDADFGMHYFPNGGNLASVLFRISRQRKDEYDRLCEYLRLILPNLRQLHAEEFVLKGAPPSSANKIALLFEQVIGKGELQSFYPSQMSAGTLRSLGILTALLQSTESGQPTLIAIEEPEAHVHPAVLAVLRDAMVEASYRNQILVATQSADLLDNKDVSVESILAFSADDGVTSISGIAEADRDMIRRKLYTPGELMRIGQLMPEPHVNGSGERLAPAGGPS